MSQLQKLKQQSSYSAEMAADDMNSEEKFRQIDEDIDKTLQDLKVQPKTKQQVVYKNKK